MSYRAGKMNVKTRVHISSLGALAVLAVTGLSACAPGGSGGSDGSGTGTPAAAPSASTPPTPSEGTVLQPGGPGDPTATGDAVQQQAPQPWNDEDATFVEMMVPHHSQALEMAALARTRAEDPRVRALAERIGASQLPEIRLMSAWMDEQGLTAGETGGMEGMEGMEGMDMSSMSGMEGMLSPGQMDALAAAQGARFDRLFLRGMIAHHEGAVTMADDVAVAGSALQVSELALDVSSGQSAEVDRMRDLLRTL